ncbi:MAG: hypothetical protein ACE5KO_04360 [Candidatus Bathyarchaeia archaeon]
MKVTRKRAHSARLHDDTTALSVAVTTAIMLGVVAALGTGVTVFSNSTFQNLQSGLGDYYGDRATALRESLAIEDVWFNSTTTPKHINVTVRNTGDIDLNVTAVYVNGTARWTTGQVLSSGQAYTIVCYFDWTPGLHNFNVATQRGNVARTTAVSP